ncbi:RDD family protein [Dechloromonas denitrificans]|uniref:RDD family protein n=1 Tax=Dechloromonas denitrificans TaxID=281362 RepID=UPI00299D8BF0|nr:RDD family protein [Dechloromonas denitrificans]
MHLDPMPPIFYPRLIRRVRAILIDSVLLPITVFGSLILGDALGVSHTYGKVALILLPIFVLEPGLVAVTGGTIGHHSMKIRIATIDGQRNINIFAATLRFLAKLLLGWLSLIFVLTTKKHQAIHDLLARSVVVHKNPSTLPAYEILAERTSDSAEYLYPAAWRRVLVIFGYWVLATVGLSIFSNIVASSKCIEGHSCATWEYLLLLALNIAWLVSLGGATVRGWRGQLYGCRRRTRGAA